MVPLGLLPEKRWRLRMVLGLSKYVLGFPREMPGCHRKTLGCFRKVFGWPGDMLG